MKKNLKIFLSEYFIDYFTLKCKILSISQNNIHTVVSDKSQIFFRIDRMFSLVYNFVISGG